MCEGSWERFSLGAVEGLLHRSGPCSGCQRAMIKKLTYLTLSKTRSPPPGTHIGSFCSVHMCILTCSFWFCPENIYAARWRVITVFMLACRKLHKSQHSLLISSREGELDYFSLMPFVWRKRCWLTAELLDPTQPGFNADAWLMRSTTGIIIRRGILAFSCVSQPRKNLLLLQRQGRAFPASDRLMFTFNNMEPRHSIPQDVSSHWQLLGEGVMVGNLSTAPVGGHGGHHETHK